MNQLFNKLSTIINRLSVKAIYLFYNSFVLGICVFLTDIMIPVSLLIIKSPLDIVTTIIYSLALIFIGPSLIAVFACYLSKDSDDDRITFRNYFKFYKYFFSRGIKLSFFHAVLVILFIFDLNILLLLKNQVVLVIPLLITFAFLLNSMFYSYRIVIKNDQLTIKNIIWLSIILSYKQIWTTVRVSVLIGLLILLTIINPIISIFILFGFSLILIVTMINTSIKKTNIKKA